MAVDLPARSDEPASMGCGVVAHGLMSHSQLCVIAAVGRGRDLSGGERRQHHRSFSLEWPRHQYTDLNVRPLVLVEHHVLPQLIIVAGGELRTSANELVD